MLFVNPSIIYSSIVLGLPVRNYRWYIIFHFGVPLRNHPFLNRYDVSQLKARLILCVSEDVLF